MATFTLSFNTNGGTEISPIQVDSTVRFGDLYPTLPTTTKDGYDFVGWYTESALGWTYNGWNPTASSCAITRNQLMYARWVPHEDNITWYVKTNGRHYNDENPDTIYGFAVNYPYSPGQAYLLQGHSINVIKFKVYNPGIITLRIFKQIDTETWEEVDSKSRTIDCSDSKAGDIIIKTFDTINIDVGEGFALGYLLDTGSPTFFSGTSTDGSLIMKFGQPGMWATGTSFDMDIGYIDDPSNVDTKLTDIYLNSSEKIVSRNQQFTLQASFEPTSASDKRIEWSILSGDDAVRIEPSGTECKVTSIKNGTAIVKVTSLYSSKIYNTCTITVMDIEYAPRSYHHLTKNGGKIRVDAAIRDGSGRKIETNYIRTVNGRSPENGNIDINAFTTAGVGLSSNGSSVFINENVVATKSYVEELVGNIEDLINGI